MSDNVTREIYVGAAMIGIAALGWFIAIPTGIDLPQSVQFSALSPDFWPRIIMVLLGVSGVVVVIQAVVERRAAAAVDARVGADEEAEEGALIEHPPGLRIARVVFALCSLFVFQYAIGHLGMIVSSIAIIFVFTVVLGQRNWKQLIPLAVLLPVILYYFFVYVAQVPMPLGVFEAWR